MNLLMTGGAGYIGGTVAAMLLRAGHRVTVLDNLGHSLTGHPTPVKIKPRRPGDPARLVASFEKAKTELGWRPQYPELCRIVASAWEWHQWRYCS